MTIGRVAKAAGVLVHTLHYYERRGLLRPARRRASGYRVYDSGAVDRLIFIKRAQELGFTLAEIGGLLRLRVDRTGRCDAVRRKIGSRLADVRGKLDGLRRLEHVLLGLLDACRARTSTEACPVLKSLEDGARRGKRGAS